MKKLEVIENDVFNYHNNTESNSIQARIDLEDLSHLFDTLSDNYSDPYGSIVRELTSNCVDANIAAGKHDEIVEVGFKYDNNNNRYIYFKDFGNGMSPEFIESTYMAFGKSTKRNNNDQLGFFGIGSKSPLSIRNEFYIITISNNILYKYIIYKGDNGIPQCELEFSKEVSSTLCGTEVILYLDYDKHKFETSIKQQLKYFSNVYYVDVDINNINDFKLYDYGKFIYNDSLNNSNNYYHQADISYGNVYYRIDYNKLDIPVLEIPIGIKIEIGQLMPNSNRETFKYNDDSKFLIKEKLIECALDLYDFIITTKKKEYENLNEYLLAIKNKENEIFDFKKLIKWLNSVLPDNKLNDNYIKYKLFDDNNIIHKSNFQGYHNFYNLFLEVDSLIKSGKAYKNKLSTISTNANILEQLIRVNKGYKKNNLKNKFIKNSYLVKRKKFKNLKDAKTFISKCKYYFKNIDKNGYTIIYKDILNYIRTNIRDYDEIEIPDYFIEENKKLKEKKLLNKAELKCIRIVWNSYKTHNTLSETIESFINIYTTKEIKINNRYYKRPVNCIIGNYDQELLLRVLEQIIPKYNNRFFVCSNRSKEQLISMENENIISVEKFMQGSEMREYFTNLILHEKLKELNLPYHIHEKLLEPTFDLINSYEVLIKKLNLVESKHIYNDNYISDNDIVKLKKEMLEFAKFFKIYDKNKIDSLINFVKELNKLKYLPWFKLEIPKDLLAEYFKEHKIKVKRIYYKCQDEFTKEETEFVHHNITKLNYLKSINKLKINKNEKIGYVNY